MLEIKDLSFSYKKRHEIFSDFSLTVPEGTVCGLLGKNGAGKSTLLYLICGLLRPQNGTITFNGYNPMQREAEFLRSVMIVAEEFTLPSVTLEKYIDANAPFYPNFDKEALNEYLNIFELTPDLHLGRLSMGQKKKAYISFAMACNTDLLILDEPTNGLDITSKRNFRYAISKCMTDEKTIIISTHQVHDVEKILDHVIITDCGKKLLNSPIYEIQEHLTFTLTPDRQRASEALLALDMPGGANIVELRKSGESETEVNLESLYELAIRGLIPTNLFNNDSTKQSDTLS